MRQGLAYETQGELEAAAEQFREAGNEAAYGIALLFEGEADKAATICNGVCLGAALFQKGEIKQSLEIFFQAEAYGFIATALHVADVKTVAEAAVRLRTLSAQNSANSGFQDALAAASSEPAEIEFHLKAAIQLDPKLADAHLRLGSLYETQG